MVVFGFIILTFIFWGFYHKDDFSQGKPISVNGDEILPQDFNRALQNRMNQFTQFYGGKKLSSGMEDLIRKQTAKALVMRLTMAQEADSLGLLIGDEDVSEEIKGFQAFKNPATGNFSPEQYKLALQNYGYTPARFEKEIRQDLMVERLQGIIDGTILISNAELNEAKAIQETSFTLSSAVLTNAGLQKSGKLKISNDEMKAYFDKHTGELLTSETRALEVATLDKGKFESALIINEDDLKKHFNSKIANSTDEQWKQARARARHILIALKGAAGKAKAEKLKKDIEASGKLIGLEAAFDKLSREKSEDFASAAHGGDLGYFTASTMDKNFSAAVFNSKNALYKVIGPVESQFGQHLIFIMDRAGSENTFENRKKEIEGLVRAEKLREKLSALKDSLNKEMAGKTQDKPEILAKNGFQIVKTEALARTHNDKVSPFVVTQKSFALPANQWSAAEEFDEGIKIFRVTAINAPRPMSFEEAKSTITEKLGQEKTEVIVKTIHQDLASSKLAWAKLSEYGAELKREQNFKPFASREVPGFSDSENILKAATGLSATKPLSQPLFQEGQWMIFSGSDFKAPSFDTEGATAKETSDAILMARRSDVFDQFVEDLIKKARISKSHREAYDL